MRWTSRLSLAALMLGSATLAQAADLPARYAASAPPPALPVFTWTGFYIGGHAGYGSGSDTTKEYLTATFTYVGLQNTFKPNGMFGGLHAGYNYQMGNVVVGLEGDFDFGKIDGGFVDPPAAPFNPGGRGRTEMDRQGSIRARLGYSFGRAMVYGTGGFAMGQLKSTYWNWPGVSENFKKDLNGYTVGAGVEYAITGNISVRAEYRFTQYKLIRNNSLVAFPGFTGTQEPKYHTVRAGVTYRF
jgi:outer membrane immunogenic protein